MNVCKNIVIVTVLAANSGTLVSQESVPIINLGFTHWGILGRSNRWAVFGVSERPQGRDADGAIQGSDLNGDGDRNDDLVIVYDLMTNNLRTYLGGSNPRFSGSRVVVVVDENLQETDINGDGDISDKVLLLHDLESGSTTPLPLLELFAHPGGWGFVADWIVFSVSERREGDDLNGDGDRDDSVTHVFDVEDRSILNLGLSGGSYKLFGARWLLLTVSESQHGQDLNGDGDVVDSVLHVHDLELRETTNLELNNVRLGDCVGPFQSDRGSETSVGFRVSGVLHVYDAVRQEVRNLGFSGCYFGSFEEKYVVSDRRERVYVTVDRQGIRQILGPMQDACCAECYPWALFGNRFAHWRSEWRAGEDINGDGDALDDVIELHDLGSGKIQFFGSQLRSERVVLSDNWLLFREDDELNAHDLRAGRTFRLGDFSGAGSFVLVGSDILSYWVDERAKGKDLNGDGDAMDWVTHIADLRRLRPSRDFLRGDCNDDGNVDISDPLATLFAIFLGNFEITCQDACDFNDDGKVDLTDAIGNLAFQFLGAQVPAIPYLSCGTDPAPDELGCDEYTACE